MSLRAEPDEQPAKGADAVSTNEPGRDDSVVPTLNGDGVDPNDDLEKAQISQTSQMSEKEDPNIVDWDGPDDPNNPQNWSKSKKWLNISSISAISLLIPLASSFFAPGVPQVLETFNTDNQSLATFVVSIYLLGFAAGPLVLGPLSELYGRLPLYHVANVLFIIFTVACALSTSMGMLIAFRFLSGLVGSTPLTVGAGSIFDIMAPADRGSGMALWSMGIVLGPIIGPVAGGFLAEAEGWRWIFWVLAIASGVTSLSALAILRESYAPVLLQRKAKRVQKETGNSELRSKMDNGMTTRDHFTRALLRPMKLLFLSPIVLLMSLYYAFVYAIMYLLFTTFTFVFQETYGFSEGIAGLTYIAFGIGFVIGGFIFKQTSDRISKRLADSHNDGNLKPEYRLPIVIVAGPVIPIGLFIYGWTAQYHIQWAVPLVGTLLVGLGISPTFIAVSTYFVDAFGMYSASAMAANTVLRSLFGATFPLFGLQMYQALGLGWGNSLLAFIGLALCPIPAAFYYYGEKLRTHPKYEVKL